MNDPYIDPRSGILRNNFGISDQRALDAKEADVVGVRAVLLQRNPIQGNFDRLHLQRIHRYLFQDVYDWAGEIRGIRMSKLDRNRGASISTFTAPEFIESELDSTLHRLREEEFYARLPRTEFANRVAGLFAEINRIHPFREGNGRAQRRFIHQLAVSLGFPMHFEVVSRERLIQASVNAMRGDVSMMERLMDEITNTDRIQPLKKVIRFLGEQQFAWNDCYVATTTAGQSYRGKFVSRDRTNFIFRDEQERLLVGNAADLCEGVKQGEQLTFTAR